MILSEGFSPDWLWRPWSRKCPTFFQSASVGWWSELIKNPGRNKNIIIWLYEWLYETHFNGIRLVGGVGGVEGGILATAETHGADGTLLQLAKRNQLFIKPSLAMWVWVYFEIFQCFNEFWYQQSRLLWESRLLITAFWLGKIILYIALAFLFVSISNINQICSTLFFCCINTYFEL